jgi:Kef-type K+ transport system membrane component KefB
MGWTLRGRPAGKGVLGVAAGALAAVMPGSALAAGGGMDDGGIGLVPAIGLAVVSAALLSVLFHRFKQPAILAYIASGLVLQAAFADTLGHSVHIMEQVSHLGLVFLLFIIGIEMDLGGIRKLGARGAVAVVLQAPAAAGAIMALQWAGETWGVPLPGLGQTREAWFYYAMVVALSSTAVVVKLLSDKFDLTTQAGRVSILTLIAQDIWAVAALTYVSMGAAGAGNGGGGGALTMVLGGVAVVALILAVTRWVLPQLTSWLARSPDVLSVVAIGWCFLCAQAMALLGFSAEMGALLAGLTIGRLAIHAEILAKVLSLRDFFMALFFVALGISLPSPTTDMLLAALPLVLWVVLARLLLYTPSLLAAGQGPVVSLAAPVNLAQISEFSLLLVPIGVAAGALGSFDVGVISYGMMISVLLSTYGIKYNYGIALRLNRLLGLDRLAGRGAQAEASAGGHEAPEVVLLGYHHNAAALARLIAAACPELLPRILVVDFNLQNHARIRAAGMRVIYGDISNPETLRHCGLEKAKAVVLTLSNTFLKGISNRSLFEVVRSINPEARFIGTASTAEGVQDILGRGAYACVSPESEAGPAYLNAIQSVL